MHVDKHAKQEYSWVPSLVADILVMVLNYACKGGTGTGIQSSIVYNLNIYLVKFLLQLTKYELTKYAYVSFRKWTC